MERRKRLAATLGLVALVLVDIALIYLALRISGPSTADETPTSSVTPTEAPAPASATTPVATPTTTSATAPTTTTTAVTVAGVPLATVVTALDGTTAWRATVGSCASGGAAVQISTDGGKSWRNRTSPYAVVTRISPTDATKGFAVGADGSCTMGVRTTTDGGATWPGTGPLAETLARDAKDPTKVRAPGGRTVAPCGAVPVVDLARNSPTGAQVLCADGKVRSSTDDGQTWPQSVDVPSALALDSKAVGSGVTAFVARAKDGCAGVQVSTVVNGAVTDMACVVTGEGVVPGNIALSVPLPNTGWLVVGTTTWRSSDGLKTWSKA
jgi:hypothetical protein